MKIPFFLAALAAAAAGGLGVVQAVSFTNSNYEDLKVGTPFTITWEGDGSVRIMRPPYSSSRPTILLQKSVKQGTLLLWLRRCQALTT